MELQVKCPLSQKKLRSVSIPDLLCSMDQHIVFPQVTMLIYKYVIKPFDLFRTLGTFNNFSSSNPIQFFSFHFKSVVNPFRNHKLLFIYLIVLLSFLLCFFNILSSLNLASFFHSHSFLPFYQFLYSFKFFFRLFSIFSPYICLLSSFHRNH